MGLDFSKLQGLNSAQEDFKEPAGIEPSQPPKDATDGGMKRLEGIQEHNQRIKEIYSQQQEYIRKAGQLRTEIIKGVAAGDDVEALFLKACECIGAMTGDTVFSEIVQKRMKEHGEKAADSRG